MYVMRKEKTPGTFRRSLRDKAGKIRETFEFPAGVAVKVTREMAPAIERDLGHGLIEVEVDARGRPRRLLPPGAEKDEPSPAPPAASEAAKDAPEPPRAPGGQSKAGPAEKSSRAGAAVDDSPEGKGATARR